MIENPDSETIKTLSEGERWRNFVLGKDWAEIKQIFTNEIMDLQSIKNLEGTTPETILMDIKARNTAIDILLKIIKQIEGRADQHKNNNDALSEEIIQQFD